MFIFCRRIAGALLVFGFLYFFVHSVWDPRPILSMPPDSSWGLFLFLGWLLTFGVAGTALLCGRSSPAWFSVGSLCMFGATCSALFGTFPPFFAHIHNERDFWLAYIFNIVPVVQFLALSILGRHNELDKPATPTGAQIAAA